MTAKKLFILSVFISLTANVSSAAEFYKEAMLIGGYSHKDGWVGKKAPNLKNSVGFEYYKKFSNEYGDFLTLNLQVRTAYDSTQDSQDAFGIEIHNAWLEYKLDLGKSIRIGHFDPAFGLEPVLDTHGTLLQTLAFQNIGFKKDWGIAYKSLWRQYDYEVAAQLGSGMSISTEDDNFLLTGRISRQFSRDRQLGLSILYGQTLQPTQSQTIPAPDYMSNKSVKKRRIGIDYQTPLGLLDFKTEVAAGDDDGKTVAGGLVEFGYVVPKIQDLKLKMQTLYWSDDWGKKSAQNLTLSPVIEYKLNSKTTLRLGYFHDFHSTSSLDRLIVLQLYYFGM